jgi:hypothetical protein
LRRLVVDGLDEKLEAIRCDGSVRRAEKVERQEEVKKAR